MRTEAMWLVVALASACGGKRDRFDAEADAECDRLPAGQLRQDCKDEYRKASRPSEPSSKLYKIGKAAKRVFGETGKYPIGDARSPGDGVSCCGKLDDKCAPQPDVFAKDLVWSKLEFSVDEPSRYQYKYHSDGTSFTAYAIGDIDCDSKSATWTMTGTITAEGTVRINLVPPPPGVF